MLSRCQFVANVDQFTFCGKSGVSLYGKADASGKGLSVKLPFLHIVVRPAPIALIAVSASSIPLSTTIGVPLDLSPPRAVQKQLDAGQ